MPQIYQSPQQSSKIVKASECMNVQLHDQLILQAYKDISIQVCAHVYGYQVNINACEHTIIK